MPETVPAPPGYSAGVARARMFVSRTIRITSDGLKVSRHPLSYLDASINFVVGHVPFHCMAFRRSDEMVKPSTASRRTQFVRDSARRSGRRLNTLLLVRLQFTPQQVFQRRLALTGISPTLFEIMASI